MHSELLINASPVETRVALLEGSRLREIYIERPARRGITGNIYKGRVDRVLPGMQAAFVDVGLERAAFLYAGDVIEDYDAVEYPEGPEEESPPPEEPDSHHNHRANPPPIQQLLKPGQEVVVQVAKEPLGTKGARVTSHISLPGRYLVYMPLVDHVGVSRRIEAPEERERLKGLVSAVRNGNGGFIVRTAAEGASEEEIRRDVAYLGKLWERIQARKEKAALGSLLHEEFSIALRAVRDILTPEIESVTVDEPQVYEQVREFLEAFEPALGSRVRLYEDSEPLFDRYGIEVSLQRLLSRKVWLPSGGYIVIDSSEALTAIDVNTGRYVGRQNFEETILKTNLEAVTEIVAQIRLRNIGGIIVLDLIDMASPASREKVHGALVEALRRDKARTTVTPISELGVIEMTRKRIREPVLNALVEECPYCNGEGRVRSLPSVSHEILRQLVREMNAAVGDQVEIRAHPDVIARLREEDYEGLASIQGRYHAQVSLKEEPGFHRERYEIRPLRN